MEIWAVVFPMTNMVLVFNSREKAYEYLKKDILKNLCPKHCKEALESMDKSYFTNEIYFDACYNDFDDNEPLEYAYVFENVINPELMITDEFFKNAEKRF